MTIARQRAFFAARLQPSIQLTNRSTSPVVPCGPCLHGFTLKTHQSRMSITILRLTWLPTQCTCVARKTSSLVRSRSLCKSAADGHQIEAAGFFLVYRVMTKLTTVGDPALDRRKRISQTEMGATRGQMVSTLVEAKLGRVEGRQRLFLESFTFTLHERLALLCNNVSVQLRDAK